MNTSFKTSINIQFDIGKPEVIERYLPTPSHADTLKGIIQSVLSTESSHAHMIVGPYGTGKSLLGTIIAGILSKTIKNKFLEKWISKFEVVDEGIYHALHKVIKKKKKYLPVIINGKQGVFRNIIISSIIQTLDKNDIKLILPGELQKIISTIEMWKNEFPYTYEKFLHMLEERKIDVGSWLVEVKNYNYNEVSWFKEVYPKLTSGAVFSIDTFEDFIDQLRYIVNELEKLNIGLLILYDEFGRFIQSLDFTHINQDMQDIQDLAELANSSHGALQVILISHRNMRQYNNILQEEEVQIEFQRIEKRYRTYYIESDHATFFRLAHSIISTKYKNINNLLIDYETVISQLRRYPLFPNMTHVEIENMIVYGMFPLHPVTLYLLPYLSNLLAQNERTLFTFLEDNEPGSLKQHSSVSNDWYFADQLFDYFYHDNEINSYDIFKTYELLISKVSSFSIPNSERIIKFITLWELVKMQGKFPLTTDFLSMALGIEKEELELTLTKLAENKIIRYNIILGNWELFEGSAIEVEKIINERDKSLILTKKQKIEILDKYLPKRYYLANDYNYEKGMIRFARVTPVWGNDLLNDFGYLDNVLSRKFSDVDIVYVLLEDEKQYRSILKLLKEQKERPVIFCVPRVSTKKIERALRDYVIINEMYHDQDLITLDNRVKAELELLLEERKYIIKKYLQDFTSFSKDYTWILNGTVLNLNDDIALENLLSQLMYDIYPNTPEIQNDSFNRRNINSVQRRAAAKVINHLLNDWLEEDISIEGYGPDYLIYVSVLKNNNIDLKNLDHLENPLLAELRLKLLNHLKEHPEGNFSTLVDIFRNPPYGIREPVIPVLLVALLRDKWEQLLFYGKDMFISDLNGDLLYEMIANDKDFTYRYYNVDKEYESLYEKLQTVFFNGNLKEKHPYRVSNRLLTWLRSLPRYTQITENISEESNWFKEVIRKGEVDPQKSLSLMLERYKNDEFLSFSKIKKELEEFMDKHLVDLETLIYKITGFVNYEDILNWCQSCNITIKQENRIVSTLLRSTSKNWVNLLAENLVGVKREDWSDTTNEMFVTQLRLEWEKANGLIENDVENSIRISVGNQEVCLIREVQLSRQAQIIYQNAKQLIQNAGRGLPKEEVQYMIWLLLDELSN
jgi:hypothetical protein